MEVEACLVTAIHLLHRGRRPEPDKVALIFPMVKNRVTPWGLVLGSGAYVQTFRIASSFHMGDLMNFNLLSAQLWAHPKNEIKLPLLHARSPTPFSTFCFPNLPESASRFSPLQDPFDLPITHPVHVGCTAGPGTAHYSRPKIFSEVAPNLSTSL